MQVALYDPEGKYGYQAAWSRNFKAAYPDGRKIFPIKGQSMSAILADIEAAAGACGAGGTLIFACGHGGTNDAASGFADIAPKNRFRLGRKWTDGTGGVDVFYDVDFGDPTTPGSQQEKDSAVEDEVARFDTPEGKQKLKDKFKTNPRLIEGYKRDQRKYVGEVSTPRRTKWLMYKKVGYALQIAGIDLVVFATCNLGQSDVFLRKVSHDWGVKIRAYRRYLYFGDGKDMQHPRCYLDGDPTDDLSPDDQTHEIPQKSSYSYIAGPLPGTEEANRRFWTIAGMIK